MGPRVVIMMNGLAIGASLKEKLEATHKTSFTIEEIIRLHAEAVMDSMKSMDEEHEKNQAKQKEAEEALPKPMSEIPS